MRIRNPKIKRALMTGMACLSTVIAVLSFTFKLPQAFLDGKNSLSVLAAGLTAPDGARNFFAPRAPENAETQSQLGQETAGSQLSQTKESGSSASPSSQAPSSQASNSESASSSQPEEPSENSENPGGEVPYTGALSRTMRLPRALLRPKLTLSSLRSLPPIVMLLQHL